MGNIYSYIKEYGDKTFEEVPINKIDILVFANLAYIPLNDIINQKYGLDISIKNACEKFLKLPNREDITLFKQDSDFFNDIANSKRYGELKILGYINDISLSKSKQFSTILIRIDDNLIVNAYCGTDISFIGWKENFDMTYLSNIPAQDEAYKYLDEAMRIYSNFDFILTGHSKGGNLAMFAPLYLDNEKQNRVIKIINFDGPGFRKEIVDSDEYKKIEPKIETILPSTSIVGMIFEHNDKFLIIKSDKAAYFSHSLYSWKVKGDRFIVKEKVSKNSLLVNSMIREYLVSTDEESRKDFFNLLYTQVSSTGAQTTKSFIKHTSKNVAVLIQNHFKMSKKEKKQIRKMLKIIVRSYFRSWYKIYMINKEFKRNNYIDTKKEKEIEANNV